MYKEIRDLIRQREQLENIVDITFYIPALNEQDNIVQTLDKIVFVMSSSKVTFEMLVYNDCSTDNTRGVVEDYIQSHPGYIIKLINNRERRGLGYNYKDGAFIGIGKYYMMICGDNSETEESMREILNLTGKADILIPYFGGLDTRSRFRKYLSKLFTFLVNLISGHNVKYYNGVVLHLRQNVICASPTSSGFGYQAELISKLLDMGKSYLHVNVSNNDRSSGITKAFMLQNVMAVIHSLLQISLRRTKKVLFKKIY